MIDLPIVTKRLAIRRFEPDDLSDYLSFMTDADSTKYLAFEEEQKTQEGANGLFDFVCSAYNSDEPIHAYAIADKQSNEYLGSCGFAPYVGGIVECYYCVNKVHRGQGIAVEAMQAVASLLSEHVEVRAYCHPENKAAHAVVIRSGFRLKGMSTHENSGRDGLLFVYDQSMATA